MTFSWMSFQMTSSELTKYSVTRSIARSLRQLSFLFLTLPCIPMNDTQQHRRSSHCSVAIFPLKVFLVRFHYYCILDITPQQAACGAEVSSSIGNFAHRFRRGSGWYCVDSAIPSGRLKDRTCCGARRHGAGHADRQEVDRRREWAV